MKKEILRKNLKKILVDNFDVSKNYSNEVLQKVLSHPKILGSQNIFVYYSFENEVPTLELISQLLRNGKNVYIPKTQKSLMKAIKIHTLGNFELGALKIPEPIETKDDSKKIDVLIVPGLGFSQKGSRIGKGGGFYDRWIEKYPNVYKIGLCFDFQIVDDTEFEKDSWDMDMDEVVIIKG